MQPDAHDARATSSALHEPTTGCIIITSSAAATAAGIGLPGISSYMRGHTPIAATTFSASTSTGSTSAFPATAAACIQFPGCLVKLACGCALTGSAGAVCSFTIATITTASATSAAATAIRSVLRTTECAALSACTASHKESVYRCLLVKGQHTRSQKFHNAVHKAFVVLPRIGEI